MSVVDGKIKTMLTSLSSFEDNDDRDLEILNHLIGLGNIFNLWSHLPLKHAAGVTESKYLRQPMSFW